MQTAQATADGAAAAAGVTLQSAYDASGVAQPKILVTAAGGGVTISDAAVPIGVLFTLEDNAGVDYFNVGNSQLNFGLATQRLYVDNNIAAGLGGRTWYPDAFTITGLVPQSAHVWSSVLTSAVPGGGGIGNDVAPGFVSWDGECILTGSGNLFNTQSLFSQATVITCQGVNTGPIYTMINQPRIRTGSSGGSRTASQQNAVRSQLSVGPNIAGNIALTSHEPFFATCFVNATVGTASITTVNYFAAKAPTLTAGGTITTLNCLDIPNISGVGITNLRGIHGGMFGGTFILHEGSAPVDFTNAAFNMDFVDNAAIRLGTANDVDISWNGTGLDLAFVQNADALIINNPVNGQLLFDVGANEYTFNTTRGFSLGAQTGTLGNQFGNFVFGAMTTPIAGEFSQFLLTQAGNLTVNQAGMNIFGWTINAPSIVLSGPGTVLEAAVLNVAGNLAEGSTGRYGVRILSNPSGATDNYPLYVVNGTSRINGLIAGDPGTEASGIDVSGTTYDSALKASAIGGGDEAQFIMHRHSTTLGPIIVGARSNSNTSAHTLVADSQDLLGILGVGWDGADYEIAGIMRIAVDGTPGNNDMPGRIEFLTTPNGSVTAALALRIRESQRCDFYTNQALGGGAGATLGTIGGSGPTAAAQAQWLEIEIAGVIHWIPAWT